MAQHPPRPRFAGARSSLLALGLVPVCLQASPQIDTGEVCEWSRLDLPTLELDSLKELSLEPACEPLIDAALERAANLLAEQQRASSLAPIDAADTSTAQVAAKELADEALMVELMRIRRAIDAGKGPWVLARLGRLLADPRPRAHLDQQDMLGLRDELDSVRKILARQSANPQPGGAIEVESEWRTPRHQCLMSSMFREFGGRHLPNPAAAWRAAGQPRAALDSLLDRYWLESLNDHQAPPQLREYAEAVFGAGSYAQDVERALPNLRIEHAADGRRAYLPVFGRELPVPLQFRSGIAPMPGQPEELDDAAATTAPIDGEALVAALRRILLSAD
jgi:hypothetical protein